MPPFWHFLCGDCPRIVVRARQLPVAPDLYSGDYAADPVFRQHFHRWLEGLWREKDAAIDALLREAAQGVAPASARSLPRPGIRVPGVHR